MSFDAFIGNKLAVGILKKALETRRIASAYLFHGPDGVGKSLAARNFAKALVCEKEGSDSCDVCSSCRRVDSDNHPDVHWYEPVGKMRLVKMASIQELITQTGLKPFESKWKLFVLLEADRMRAESQNAVLKTLEEPPGQTVLILVSSNAAGLLPTIISRCQEVCFLPIPRDEMRAAIEEKWGLAAEEARLVASLASGSLGSAKQLLERDNLSRRKVLITLLSDISRRSFQDVRDTLVAVNEELDEMRKALRAEEEKRIKPQWKMMTAEERDEWMDEVNAKIESIVTQEVEDILNQLAFWYRDLLIVKADASAELVTNFDMMESLRSSAAEMTVPRILSRLGAVEEARRAIGLNLSLTSCLEVFYLRGSEATVK
jgi:DNA polymerase-3 subunit delta'